MATSASSPGRRSSPALWAGLLVAAAAAWVLLIRQSPGMPGSMAGPWLEFGQFLLLWIVMMAAMMLPSVAPVASMYVTVLRSRGQGTAAGRTTLLVTGYLLAWAGFGVLAFGLSRALGTLAPMGMSRAPSGLAIWSAAVILAVAGLYQFTPLKARCLRHCRSPLGFLLHFGNYSGRAAGHPGRCLSRRLLRGVLLEPDAGAGGGGRHELGLDGRPYRGGLHREGVALRPGFRLRRGWRDDPRRGRAALAAAGAGALL